MGSPAGCAARPRSRARAAGSSAVRRRAAGSRTRRRRFFSTSVSTTWNSVRRLSRLFATSTGRSAPKPRGRSWSRGTPRAAKAATTASARSAASSSMVVEPHMGDVQQWPSTRTTRCGRSARTRATASRTPAEPSVTSELHAANWTVSETRSSWITVNWTSRRAAVAAPWPSCRRRAGSTPSSSSFAATAAARASATAGSSALDAWPSTETLRRPSAFMARATARTAGSAATGIAAAPSRKTTVSFMVTSSAVTSHVASGMTSSSTSTAGCSASARSASAESRARSASATAWPMASA